MHYEVVTIDFTKVWQESNSGLYAEDKNTLLAMVDSNKKSTTGLIYALR